MPMTKSAKRFTKKLKKNLKRRYFKGQGYKNPKLVQIARDVMTMKSLLNVEKKTLLIEEREPINIGLITNSNKTLAVIDGETVYNQRDNVAYSGAYIKTNLTGTPTRGTADNQIVGDRIKVVSYHMDYRIKALEADPGVPANGWGNRTSKIHLYLLLLPRGDQVLTNDITAETHQEVLLQRFFEPSVFDTTYDGTRRNISYMKDFKVLGKKTLYVKHDEDHDEHSTIARSDFKFEGTMGAKLEDTHMRWDGSKLIKNQFAMVAIADAGTVDGTPGNENRFTLEYSMKMYYVDN